MKVTLADMNEDWYGTIVRYVDLNDIMIDIPVNGEKKQIPLSKGVELEFRFSRMLGMYTFKAKFEEIYKGMDLAIISKPVEIFKIRSRNSARLPVCIKALINQRYGKIKNLSAGGLFISTDYRCNIGDIVNIYFELKKTDIRLTGQVVWLSGDNGYGIKFIEIEQDKADFIDHYVLKNIVKKFFL